MNQVKESAPDWRAVAGLQSNPVSDLATLEVEGAYETSPARVLGSAGIPMEQFKDCEAESKRH
jgi:hypothetical protein